MKPVEKGAAPQKYEKYGDAKPHLVALIGSHCSYCERGGDPQLLDVEHIYPQKAHPGRELDWENFLIACGPCNTIKRHRLGDGRQRGLLKRYLWPHCDNTFNAFEYFADGRVEIRAGLSQAARDAAEATRNMVGLTTIPPNTESYAEVGEAYDGASTRSQKWALIEDLKTVYVGNPSPASAAAIANAASVIGYFSICMEVFHDRPEVRRELIRAFRADSDCFDDATTQPKGKGRL